MATIRLNEENLFVIKSTRIRPSGNIEISYYESPSVWITGSPIMATLFRDYDAAWRHVTMYQQRDAAPKGWADGSTETFDVVPCLPEMLSVGERMNKEV